MKKITIHFLVKIILLLGGGYLVKNNQLPTQVGKNNGKKEKPKKVINIIVDVDLQNKYHTINGFVFDGYIIPNVNSPYYATQYMRDWMRARNIGDGRYNFAATEFMESCINTKTSATKMYYGYEINIKIAQGEQTLTNTNM